MFELDVKLTSPMLHESNLDIILINFLLDIGYLSRGDPYTDQENIKDSVAYKLFKDCFLIKNTKVWTPEELINYLNTTRTTLYRHLNRLRALDLLEESQIAKKKGYRLRYGELEGAWNFVEANVNMAMKNYKETIEHIQNLVKK